MLRAVRGLGAPGLRRIAFLAAIALVAPTLVSGFALDDYVLLYQMAHPGSSEWGGSVPFDLFRWMDPAHDLRLMDGAGMPWWTFAQASCAFLRPLSSLTHALDHWLWPHSAFGMHAHSLIWFALLLFVAAKTYAALLENPWVANVAAAIFALDSAHGEAVGWISNRNALISATFGIAALLLHHRSRSGTGLRLAIAAAGCYALSLCAGELGVGSAGYLFAYALLFERGPRGARVASLLPYAAITAIWAVVRSAGHYGTFGLGVYVDPIKEPWAFLAGLPSRLPLLLSSQVSRVCSDLYDALPPPLKPWLLAYAVSVCVFALWFTWPSLRERRALRFWALGAGLSLLPLAATLPNDRLLVLVGLGVLPVLAQAIHDAFELTADAGAPARTRDQGLRRGFALLLAGVHFVVDPLMLPLLALSPALVAQPAEAAEQSLPATPELARQAVIVAAVSDSALLSYLPVMRSFNGKPRPEKLFWLAATPQATRFERRGPNALRVSSTDGFFDRRWESRSPRLPFRQGDRVQLSEMTIEVVTVTDDGRPSVCDFLFAHPLESSRYLWLIWRAGHLEAFISPQTGKPATHSAND